MQPTVRLISLLAGVWIAGADAAQPLNIVNIAGGARHCLALASDGTVWAWGDNQRGQLGDGSPNNGATPVRVKDLVGVISIAAGGAHSLALKSDGTVWAWGDNREGQLGDGTRAPHATPVQVSGLGGIVAISAGGYHSLALRADGTVWNWGANSSGQLGDGTFSERTFPSRARGLADTRAIAAGTAHSLALTADGTVWAWGANSSGQAGNIQAFLIPTPAPVTGIRFATAIAAGSQHSVALKADGTVWTWGVNGTGFGVSPEQVGNIGEVVGIAAGNLETIALKADWTAWEWGTSSSTPAQMRDLVPVAAISSSGTGGLALARDGSMWAWRAPHASGDPGFRSSANPVSALVDVVAVAQGLALKRDGTIWEWNLRSKPSQVLGLPRMVAIAKGASNLAVGEDGRVWQWRGPVVSRIENLSRVISVAAGEHIALALREDGTVWQWWDDDRVAERMPGLDNIVDVTVTEESFQWSREIWGSYFRICTGVALRGNGTVLAWSASREIEGPPVFGAQQIPGLGDIVTIASGPVLHGDETFDQTFGNMYQMTGTAITLAVKSDGTVWELTGRVANQVPELFGARAISVSPIKLEAEPHRLVLKTDGTVWAWGPNASGQLGDGTTTQRTRPIQVGGFRDGAAVAAVGSASIAVKQDGTVWAWGRYGVSTYAAQDVPVRISPPGAPDLAIAMSHTDEFRVGGNAVYILAITNLGEMGASGGTTVVDMLPPGLTFASAGGIGWSCATAGERVTCVHADPIAPGASTTITLNATVERQAYPGVTNLATVSNPEDFYLANNTAGDPAPVLP